jgi:hypothetical protein
MVAAAMIGEIQWLTSHDPKAMLAVLRGRADERKLRLFAAACYRSPGVWPTLAGLKLMKEHVDGIPPTPPIVWDGSTLYNPDALTNAERVSIETRRQAQERNFQNVNLDWAGGQIAQIASRQFEEETAYQCRLLRCVFGNPGRVLMEVREEMRRGNSSTPR